MRQLYLLLGFCLIQLAVANASGQYTVIGPGTIHSSRKYTVAVGVYQTSEPCKIEVGITGPSYNETKTLELNNNDMKSIDFNVPHLEEGTYNLTAHGISGIEFKNTTALNWAQFVPYTTIQTDKGMYKPGDTLNFRVLFLDENLKPTQPRQDTVVYIEDGRKNRIKEYKNIDAPKGVFTEKFKISEYPIEGQWHITCDSRTSDYPTVSYISVEKYVLPKFVVKMESTQSVSVRDGDMHAVVRANYTHGKPFEGKVTLVVKLNFYVDPDDTKAIQPPAIIKSASMVNGKAKLDFNVKEYAMFLKDKRYPSSLDLTATVEEPFTEVKINTSSYTTLYPYRYEMQCINYTACVRFDANQQQEVMLTVRHVDDSFVENTKAPVKLIYKETFEKKMSWSDIWNKEDAPKEPQIKHEKFEFMGHLNATGFVTFKVTLPDLEEFEHFQHFFKMEAEFIDETREILSSYQYRKPKELDIPYEPPMEPTDYFKVHIVHEPNKWSIDIGEKVILNINSSEPLQYLDYIIVGRGNIYRMEHVDLSSTNPKVYNITFTADFMMSPSARVYVYYVNKTGDFIFGEEYLSIEVKLQNEISLKGPTQVKPGEEVSIGIKTAPHSFVGLLAVDQSVLLLRDNNDVQLGDFRWKLSTYDTRTKWQGGYSHYPGEYSGLVTFTNANYPYNRTVPDYQANRKVAYSAVSKTGFMSTPMADSVGGAVRPEMASGAAGSIHSAGNIQVRKNFEETWIFANIEDTQTEEFNWAKKIPDTLTSWVLTGFSLNPEKGLGVTSEKTKIQTFLPFFVSVSLPYSVKRGEVIKVPALVFNYLEKDLDVQVTLDNSDGEYEFTEISNEVLNDVSRTQTIRVPANSAKGVAFMLRPKIIGNIMLKLTAVSPVAGDAIHKTLKVVPEGVTQYGNKAYFVNLHKGGEQKESYKLDLPDVVVPDSEHIEFGVVGDLLGPVLNNLDKLLRLPMGCGEQTVSAMIPNYMVLRYLKMVKKLTPILEARMLHNLQDGYQNILRFRHEDGSFGSFGFWRQQHEMVNGSTWLTAYVARSLSEIHEYVNVNDEIVEKAIEFLISKQAQNGSFLETGSWFYASQRHHLTLTASVLQALEANKTYAEKYSSQMQKAYEYIVENVDKAENLHAKAYVTFVLQKAQNTKAKEMMAKLKSLAKTEDDRMWWSSKTEVSGHHWRWSFSNEVETTAYLLSTLLDQSESIESVFPIVKWLVAQRNSYGGFSSTQDTVVGLQALIDFVQKSGYEPAIMNIEYTAEDGKNTKDLVKVTEDNALLMQISELPPKSKGIDFMAQGTGAALVQLSYQYNIAEKEKKPSFAIEATVAKDTPPSKLVMDVCVQYIGEGESSNMAILDIALPSGYVAEDSSFEDVRNVDKVRLVEFKNSNSGIIIYFENLAQSKQICLPIEAFKSHAVALQKPSAIVLYDYYETDRRSTVYYAIDSKLCDLCENDEQCLKACK